MRDFLTSSGRRLRAGAFWVAVLVILPNCSFNPGGLGPGRNFYPGTPPRNSAIFCHIEKKEAGRRCATADDLNEGIRLAEAAIALNEGRRSNIAIDESSTARARCGGEPEAILLEGPFPDGFPLCVNCGEIVGVDFADVNAACQARCFDFYGTTGTDGTLIPQNPPADDVRAFCEDAVHVRAATNQPVGSCFENVCTDPGTVNLDFIDPRRTPEAVIWQDLLGGAASAGLANNDLVRTSITTLDFNAGAASVQRITEGDAYVEFSASQNDQGHAIGFSHVPITCLPPCPDADPTLDDIDFGMVLSTGGFVGIVESGTNIPGPDVGGTFGPYATGERFRVRLRDNSDGTAIVSFTRLVGPCTAGVPCNEVVLFTRSASAAYPFRVDASLRQQDARLTDVRVMRIQ